MRLMIVGSDKIYAIENFYRKYIKEQGAEVMQFTAQSYFYDYYQKSLVNKILYRSGFSGIIKKINDGFKQAVEQFAPQAIWVFKGMEILPATLQWAKERNILLANYNTDNPFIFSGAGSGNENIRKSISLYDLHFTYNLEIKSRLERDGIKTFFLPFGFDLNERLYEACCLEKEIIKACFIGNPDKERAGFINKLVRKGIDIDIYGHHWNKFVKHPKITLFPAVYGDDFWKVLRKYRIQLNLMRIHNLDSHNMRSFEVPGAGGLMLAPDTAEHRLFFKEKPGVFLFSDIEDCVEQAKALLLAPKTRTDTMRHKVRQMSLDYGYSYKDRAHTVLEHLKGSLALRDQLA